MSDFLIELKKQSLNFLHQLHISNFWSIVIQSALTFILILCIAWLADKLATLIMRRFVPKIIGKTNNNWDDILLKNKVFSNISHFIPGFIVLAFYKIIASKDLQFLIELLIESYFIIVFLLVVNAIINSFSDIYGNIKGESGNIKIYLQLAKVIMYSLGAIAIISIFANKNFIDILKGLGAMLTVLLIVYKDTIMGFVAGIQLAANKMLKVGDWVSLPKANADGTVTEISLNTVKIQNWDKTITTVPTYKLMSESFTNWRGMEESGGRRIKRHINIDMDSVHFLSEEEINRLQKIDLLTSYINEKLEVLKISNQKKQNNINQRKLTNIGTFRKYIENYLLSTGFVNTEMTFIVRQLQPTELGVPIEIYMFCTEKAWAIYEEIQSDIFDHIFAIITEFNLRIFQRPSSTMFSKNVLEKD